MGTNSYHDANWMRCFNRFKEDFYKGEIQDSTCNWFHLQVTKYKEGSLKKERLDLLNEILPNILTLTLNEVKIESVTQKYGKEKDKKGYNIHLFIKPKLVGDDKAKETLYKFIKQGHLTVISYCKYCHELYREDISKYNRELASKGVSGYDLLKELLGNCCPSELELALYYNLYYLHRKGEPTIPHAEFIRLYLKDDSNFLSFLKSGYDFKVCLSSKELYLLDLKYNKHKSYDDIGKELGVSKERARQAESKAIRKIRVNRRSIIRVWSRENNKFLTLRELDYLELQKVSKQEGTLLVEDLNISVRSFNCLLRAGIKDTSTLEKISVEEFIQIRNLGRKCSDEIIGSLKELNLCNKLTKEYEEWLLNR